MQKNHRQGRKWKTNFIPGEVLFHLLFVDEELAKVMERVERYNRKYGPIIQSARMQIQGCVRPSKSTGTTKRTTDEKPGVKAEAIPRKSEREEVERAPQWMLTLFLLVLVLAIRGTASLLS